MRLKFRNYDANIRPPRFAQRVSGSTFPDPVNKLLSPEPHPASKPLALEAHFSCKPLQGRGFLAGRRSNFLVPHCDTIA